MGTTDDNQALHRRHVEFTFKAPPPQATGRTIGMGWPQIVRRRDGHLAERWAVGEGLGEVRQLGARALP